MGRGHTEQSGIIECLKTFDAHFLTHRFGQQPVGVRKGRGRERHLRHFAPRVGVEDRNEVAGGVAREQAFRRVLRRLSEAGSRFSFLPAIEAAGGIAKRVGVCSVLHPRDMVFAVECHADSAAVGVGNVYALRVVGQREAVRIFFVGTRVAVALCARRVHQAIVAVVERPVVAVVDIAVVAHRFQRRVAARGQGGADGELRGRREHRVVVVAGREGEQGREGRKERYRKGFIISH